MRERLLRLRQRRAQLVADMATYSEANSANWGADHDSRWAELESELRSTEADIARVELVLERQADLDRTDGRGAAVPPGDGQNPPGDPPANRQANAGAVERVGPWLNIAHFMHDLRFDPNSAGMRELREMSLGIGAEGGILVPPQFRAELLQFSPEEAIIRPRALVIPAGDMPDAELSMPALTQGAAGVYGGVTVTWTGEGATMTETDAELEEIKLKPSEVTAYVKLSNMLMRNSPAASTIIQTLLRSAIIGSEDYAFLRGSGVNRPLGIMNCPGKLTYTRATTNEIVYADCVGMMAKLHPESYSRAMWVANVTTIPQLMQMEDSGGHLIFVQGDATKGIPATLLGFPIKFNGRTPVLGSTGDLMLIDPKAYLIKDGMQATIGISEHVHFTANKTVIKIVRSVDGQGWAKEPLTLEDGSTQVSVFVILQAA